MGHSSRLEAHRAWMRREPASQVRPRAAWRARGGSPSSSESSRLGRVALSSNERTLLVLVVVEIALFVVSLPGFGVETRSFTQYAAWAGPEFLLLTLLIFIPGVIAVVYLFRKPARAGSAAILSAIAALATVALDTSHVGGPPPPPGPFWLGVVAALIAVAIIVCGWRVLRRSEPTIRPTEA